ncbi:MAG: CRISPR-associated protein Csx3 [Elainella sp. Prado103]|jgi:CRISPR-associated protein Csx3|nr:CRISPR-associated protein Csx3 [Elainella sp. Prado103]
MTTFKIEWLDPVLKIGFGEPAQNDQIVQDAAQCLDQMIASGQLSGGALLKINGPASLPVAFVIAHKVAHLYGAVACFDPKLARYVVCITHDPARKLGDLIP